MGPFVMIAERNWEHPWKEKQIYIIFAICIPNEHLLLWPFALPASSDDLHRMLASNIRRNRFLLISISQAFLNDIIIIIYWCAQYLHEFNFKMYHTHHVSARSEWVIEWVSMATHIKIKLIISLNNDVCCEKKQQEDEEEKNRNGKSTMMMSWDNFSKLWSKNTISIMLDLFPFRSRRFHGRLSTQHLDCKWVK